MFCPFVKGQCEPDCVFNNNCFDEDADENCNILDAIRNIQSDGFTERSPRDYLDSIESHLNNIDVNSGSDQTDSSYISNKLDDILKILDEIKTRP